MTEISPERSFMRADLWQKRDGGTIYCAPVGKVKPATLVEKGMAW
ncbi:MAG: hypothetical protein P8Z00_12860 [Anaerolineales bacterium]